MQGWVIGVLVEAEGAVARHYFAVLEPERARAEWLCADRAQAIGPVATSPHGGHEPVEAVAPLSPRAAAALAGRTGEIQPLGVRLARKWIA